MCYTIDFYNFGFSISDFLLMFETKLGVQELGPKVRRAKSDLRAIKLKCKLMKSRKLLMLSFQTKTQAV